MRIPRLYSCNGKALSTSEYFRNWCYSLPTPLADMQDGPYPSFAVLLRAGVYDDPAEFIARFAWGRLSSKADIRESGHRRRIRGDAIGAAPSPCASRALSRQRAASSIARAMPSPSSWLVGLPARMRPRLLAAIGSTTDRVATHDLELDLGDADEPKGIGALSRLGHHGRSVIQRRCLADFG